jgi:hypothetical protein
MNFMDKGYMLTVMDEAVSRNPIATLLFGLFDNELLLTFKGLHSFTPEKVTLLALACFYRENRFKFEQCVTVLLQPSVRICGSSMSHSPLFLHGLLKELALLFTFYRGLSPESKAERALS